MVAGHGADGVLDTGVLVGHVARILCRHRRLNEAHADQQVRRQKESLGGRRGPHGALLFEAP